ncbi:hypothetical protein Tco_1456350 [Tanacetum coccineum]
MVESSKATMVEYLKVESSKATEKDYRKMSVTDEMVEYVLEKYEKNWNFDDEITNVIFEDLWMKYGKDEKAKEKEAEHDQLNEKAEHDKGKGKEYDLDDVDLESRIKKLVVDFELVQVSSNEGVSSEEGVFSDEDVVLFNDIKYPLTDAKVRMFKERPTRSKVSTVPLHKIKAPTASTFTFKASTRSRAPIASTSNAQATSTSASRCYRKIAMTGCVLGLRAPDDPNDPSPSAPRKRKSKSS